MPPPPLRVVTYYFLNLRFWKFEVSLIFIFFEVSNLGVPYYHFSSGGGKILRCARSFPWKLHFRIPKTTKFSRCARSFPTCRSYLMTSKLQNFRAASCCSPPQAQNLFFQLNSAAIFNHKTENSGLPRRRRENFAILKPQTTISKGKSVHKYPV